MIYEKRIRSLQELRKQLVTLDGDAGVRIVGAYGGAKCFAFVTRFHEKYTVMVHGAKGGRFPRPGKALLSREFEGATALMAFLETVAGEKLEAYAY